MAALTPEQLRSLGLETAPADMPGKTSKTPAVVRFLGTLGVEASRPLVTGAVQSGLGFYSGLTGKNKTANLPLYGEVRAPINVQNLRDTSGARQAAGNAVGLGLTAATMGGGGAVAKTALRPVIAYSKISSIIPKAGKVTVPVAKTVTQAVKRAAVQATADSTLGLVSSVANDLSLGEKDKSKILTNALSSAAFSAVLPYALSAPVGVTKGVARSVGTRDSSLKSVLSRIGRTTAEATGVLDESAVSALEKGALGRRFRTSISQRIADLETQLATTGGKTPMATPEGRILEGRFTPSTAKQTKALERKLAVTKALRDFTKNWVDDRAPISINLAGRLKDAGADDASVQNVLNAQNAARSTDSVATMRVHDGIASKLEALRPQNESPELFASRVNEYADLLTKSETQRADTAGLEAVRARLAEIEASTPPDVMAKVKEAQQSLVKFNDEQLALDVASGLRSAADAQALKQANPNYSKLIVMEYLDEPVSMRGGGVSKRRDLQGFKELARKLDAGADLETLPATEANALGALMREKARARNAEIMSVVDADLAHGSGVFSPVYTEADENLRKILLERQASLGDEKAGLLKSAKDKLASIRKERSARNALEKFRKDIKGDVVSQEVREFEDALSDMKRVKGVETAQASDKISEVKAAIQVEKETKKQNDDFRKAMRKALASYKQNGKASVDEISNLKVLIETHPPSVKATSQELVDSLERLSLDRTKSRAGKASLVEASKKLDGVASSVEKRLQSSANQAVAKRQSAIDGLYVERDKLLNKIEEISEVRGDISKELFALNAKRDAAGANTVSLKRNGITEVYQVNDPQILEYFQNKVEQDTGTITKLLQGAASFTRSAATEYNPIFGISNMVRDYQNALFQVPSSVGFGIDDVIAGYDTAKKYVKTGEMDDLMRESMEIGAPLSTFISQGEKNTDAIAQMVTGKTPKPTALERLKRQNEVSELATRIGVLRAAKRAGITDKDTLRDLVRNSTVDFSVSGEKMRSVNKVIPFINARLQGLRNTLKRIADSPAESVRKAQVFATFPQLLIDAVNLQHPQAAARVSQTERVDGFPIVLGEYKDKVTGTTKPIYFTVPKGSIQQMESLVRELVTDDSLSPKQRAEDFMIGLARFSPIDSSVDVGGSVAQTLRGLTSNKDWRGYDIVPSHLNNPETAPLMQKRSTTSPTAVGLAEAINKVSGVQVSPAKLEFTARTLVPGLGSEAVNLADAARNAVIEGTPKAKNVESDSALAQLAALPGFRRFVKAQGLEQSRAAQLESENISRQTSLKKGREKEAGQKLIEDIKKAPTKEDKIEALKAAPDEVKASAEKILKSQGDFMEGISSSQSPSTRAVLIYNILTSDRSREDKVDVAKRLQERKLYTPEVDTYTRAYTIYKKTEGLSDEEKVNAYREYADAGVLDASVAKALLEYNKIYKAK